MTLDGLAGGLTLRPGATPAVVCERPMVGAALLGRLTTGRRAVLLPDLIASVFVLCAGAQRSTARRAVKAALGLHDNAATATRDARSAALHAARDHLQRLALDLPTLAAADATPVQPAWLRDAPVMALPAGNGGSDEAALQVAAAALPGWLERRLFGMPVRDWLEAWQAEQGAWLARWCAGRAHPVAQWLNAVRDDARAVTWPCRPLDAVRSGEAGMRTLAAALAADAAFAERPLWGTQPAETGPWTRHGREAAVFSAWDRLGTRLAELAHIATGATLAAGALTLRDGEGIAWTEMSRGLLVHWVRLEPGERDASAARVARFHVLAPTEWNFHPQGAFARALGKGAWSPEQVRLAAATLDPCLVFAVEQEARNA